MAEKMVPFVREGLCRGSRLFDVEGVPFAKAVISLGKGVDELQEIFAQQELLAEMYMVEALSSELLLEAYVAFNLAIAEETRYHVARYHFLGSEEAYPIEGLPTLLEELGLPVRCNEACCLIPKKSVAFVAELTEDETVQCRGICTGCDSKNCPNRMTGKKNVFSMIADMTDVPLSYGYSRIFGRR